MQLRTHKKQFAAIGIAVMMATAFIQGCGAKTPEAMLAAMKEFKTADGSVSIQLDKAWETEDLGMDSWLAAGSSRGDKAAIIMQFPKKGSAKLASSMDEVIEIVSDNYKVSELTASTAPEIPGMAEVTANTCKISIDGDTADSYLVHGETDYAYYALLFAANRMNDMTLRSFQTSCTTFQEEAPQEEDATTVEITDTVRWFNASYAVLSEINGWDYNRFAGLPANEETKELEQRSLEEWWSVTDRTSADETLDWILSEGHRTTFAENMQTLEEAGLGDVPEDERTVFLLTNFQISPDEASQYLSSYEMYAEYGPKAITGWDYCRAMNLMSFYYLAGYYSEQEALDKSLEIAQIMQPLFESWDDLMDSYLRGYEYWAEESSEERRAIYEELKTRDDNPYQIDYKTNLVKTW